MSAGESGPRGGDWSRGVRVPLMLEVRILLHRTLFLLALVAALTIVGTVAFLRLPGWSLSDALYMTIITLSAVGYQEVQPLTDRGRLITGFLLAGGITAMGLWFAVLTSAIVEMDLANVFRARKAMRKIKQLKDPVGSPLAGVTLAEARIRSRTGLIVIAIRHGEGAFIYNPGPDEEIRAEDYLIVLGGSEQIDSLQEIVRA